MTKVLIGLSTADYIRKADFLPYFLGIDKPEGTAMTTIHGVSPAKSRNVIVEQALANDCTHILFLDDDMTPSADILNRLLKHNKDIVTALYLKRDYPHFPVAFDRKFDNGFNKHLYLDKAIDGLIEVTNCGLGCVLIKIEVFKKMERPWVRLGELIADGWCDDIGFFNRAREAGFKIYCDTEARVGHMTTLIVEPIKGDDGLWYTQYKHNAGNVCISQVVLSSEETDRQIQENNK